MKRKTKTPKVPFSADLAEVLKAPLPLTVGPGSIVFSHYTEDARYWVACGYAPNSTESQTLKSLLAQLARYKAADDESEDAAPLSGLALKNLPVAESTVQDLADEYERNPGENRSAKLAYRLVLTEMGKTKPIGYCVFSFALGNRMEYRKGPSCEVVVEEVWLMPAVRSHLLSNAFKEAISSLLAETLCELDKNLAEVSPPGVAFAFPVDLVAETCSRSGQDFMMSVLRELEEVLTDFSYFSAYQPQVLQLGEVHPHFYS